MDELYLFWNCFNLLIICMFVLSAGILIGSFISSTLSSLLQLNDPAISIFTKVTGFAIGLYIFSPYVFGTIKEFSIRIWQDLSLQ